MDMNAGGAPAAQMQQMPGGQAPPQFQEYAPPGAPQMMDQNMMQNAQMQNLMQQQMMQPGHMPMGAPMQQPMGGYGFAARPQVVRPKQYRDPYREYM